MGAARQIVRGGLPRKAEKQIAGRIFIAVCPFEINRKSLWNVATDKELTVNGSVCTGLRVYRASCVQGLVCTGLRVYRAWCVQGLVCTGLRVYRAWCVQGLVCTGLGVYRASSEVRKGINENSKYRRHSKNKN